MTKRNTKLDRGLYFIPSNESPVPHIQSRHKEDASVGATTPTGYTHRSMNTLAHDGGGGGTHGFTTLNGTGLADVQVGPGVNCVRSASNDDSFFAAAPYRPTHALRNCSKRAFSPNTSPKRDSRGWSTHT